MYTYAYSEKIFSQRFRYSLTLIIRNIDRALYGFWNTLTLHSSNSLPLPSPSSNHTHHSPHTNYTLLIKPHTAHHPPHTTHSPHHPGYSVVPEACSPRVVDVVMECVGEMGSQTNHFPMRMLIGLGRCASFSQFHSFPLVYIA